MFFKKRIKEYPPDWDQARWTILHLPERTLVKAYDKLNNYMWPAELGEIPEWWESKKRAAFVKKYRDFIWLVVGNDTINAFLKRKEEECRKTYIRNLKQKLKEKEGGTGNGSGLCGR